MHAARKLERAHPCPDCGHDTEHEDEVAFCEVRGCNCDRTSVDGFWQSILVAHPFVGHIAQPCGDCGKARRDELHAGDLARGKG